MNPLHRPQLPPDTKKVPHLYAVCRVNVQLLCSTKGDQPTTRQEHEHGRELIYSSFPF